MKKTEIKEFKTGLRVKIQIAKDVETSDLIDYYIHSTGEVVENQSRDNGESKKSVVVSLVAPNGVKQSQYKKLAALIKSVQGVKSKYFYELENCTWINNEAFREALREKYLSMSLSQQGLVLQYPNADNMEKAERFI